MIPFQGFSYVSEATNKMECSQTDHSPAEQPEAKDCHQEEGKSTNHDCEGCCDMKDCQCSIISCMSSIAFLQSSASIQNLAENLSVFPRKEQLPESFVFAIWQPPKIS